MKKLITYLSLLLLFAASCSDDDTGPQIPGHGSKPEKLYKIYGSIPTLTTIEVGNGALYVGGWYSDKQPQIYIEGDKIRLGSSKNRKVIAEINGDQITGKTQNGKEFVATIDRFDFVVGPTKYGYRIGYVEHSTGDTPDKDAAALGAVYFLYFTNNEYPDKKNYTYVRNPQTLEKYAFIENGELFTSKSNSPLAYAKGDTVYRYKDIIAIQSGNQILEPVSNGIIATIENNKLIRYGSPDNEIIAIIDGDDPAAGKLAMAAYIINGDIHVKAKIKEKYSLIATATIYHESILFEGDPKEGKPLAILNGDHIIRGDSKEGEIIGVIKDNQIIKGKSKDGKAIAEIRKNKIIQISSSGTEVEIAEISGQETIKSGALGVAYLLLLRPTSYNTSHITNKYSYTLATIYDYKLYRGNTKDGKPLAILDGNNIIRGSDVNGEIIAVIEGNQIIKGSSANGKIIAEINNNEIIEINLKGEKVIMGYVRTNILSIEAGALGAAFFLLLDPAYNTSRITNNHNNTTRAVVHENKLYEGDVAEGNPLAIMDEDKIMLGSSANGNIVARINENKVTAGSKVIAEIKDNKIIHITPSGKQVVIGNISGDETIKAGALGAVYFLMIDMPNNPTWIPDDHYGYTSAIVYEDKLYKGGSLYADPIAIMDGNKIIRGSSKNGLTLAVISGNKVIKDENVIAEIEDNQIFRVYGSGKKTLIGHFYGNESPRAGALAAVYLLLLDDDSSGSGSSGGSSGTTKSTYIRKGSSGAGTIVATVQNNKLIKGKSTVGATVAVLNGKTVQSGIGTTLAVIDGNNVRKGSPVGTVIANINGSKIIKGSSKAGTTIGIIDGDGGTNAGALGAVYLLLIE